MLCVRLPLLPWFRNGQLSRSLLSRNSPDSIAIPPKCILTRLEICTYRLLIPLNVCRKDKLYLPWECENERHAYEK